MSHSLAEISADLARLAAVLADHAPMSTPPAAEVAQSLVLLRPAAQARLAIALYQERRSRDAVLGNALFGEPAWDMLLDLYARQRLGKRTSMSDACLAAMVPHSTALRHLNRMLAEGLLTRETDRADGRRSWLQINNPLMAQIDDYLERLAITRVAEGRSTSER